MGYVTVILMFLLGCLGAAPMIIAKKPDARELIDKLVPIQGILGIAGLVLGILGILGNLRYIGHLFGIVALAASIVLAILGFLMGFGLISKWMSGSPEAAAKAANLRMTLTKFQVPLGLVAIGLSIWWLLMILRIL